jgi:phosphinothricin acetyltransferase
MSIFKVQRATERDLAALERLCAEATASPAGLVAHRRDRWSPAPWIAARLPLIVAVEPAGVVGFAVALPDSAPLAAPRCVEGAVFVTSAQRRRGAGRALLAELVAVARIGGLWKLIAYALPEDAASRALLARLDFREVGVLAKHLQVGGGWRDVALHERLVLAARKSAPSFSDA